VPVGSRGGRVFARARRLGLTLPEVEEGTVYGSPALKVDGAWFVTVPTNKAAEPESLAVRLSFIERDLRIQAEPRVYYLKPHYLGYPCALVRATLLDDDALLELLETGRQFARSSASAENQRGKRR
jgi:hypothetical protein